MATLHAQHAAAVGKSRLDSLSVQAMWLSILGVLVCCWPVSGLGLVQAIRARGMAKTQGVTPPNGANLGFSIGIVGAVLSIVMWTVAIVGGLRDEDAAKARIGQLEEKAKAGVEAGALSHDVACALAEAHVLKTGFDGHSGPTLSDFECLGKVDGDAERAALSAFRFKYSSTKYETNVCFQRGVRWFVHEASKEPCAATSATPAVTAAPSALPASR